jgi:predicted O-methyltransferase YrrM
MRRFISKLAKGPRSAFRRQKAKRLLTPLLRHESTECQRLAHAILDTLNFANSDEERRWISLIEQRRSALLRSESKIPVIDYGAGKAESPRTKEEMDRGVNLSARVCDIARASKPQFLATLLFNVIRKMKPSSCVELGSCVGISAAYQAAALRINGSGRLVTLEGSPAIADLAQDTFDLLGLENVREVRGPFQEKMAGVLTESQPIDYFFNDGHHDRDAVLRYFDHATPFLSSNAIVIFDDISWSPGMREAWNSIEADKRVAVSVDLTSMGIALIGPNFRAKERYTIPL